MDLLPCYQPVRCFRGAHGNNGFPADPAKERPMPVVLPRYDPVGSPFHLADLMTA